MRKSLIILATLIGHLASLSAHAHGLTQEFYRLRPKMDFLQSKPAHWFMQHRKLTESISQLSEDNADDPDTQNTSQAIFKQLVNPQDAKDARTFDQRYFLNSSNATAQNAPVLFFICGESTCSASDLGGATAEYARKLGAHRIALEHRYYGASQPFPTLSTANMQYLTVENALLDLARFQRWAQTELKLTGPWIVIGGSYPGALSAFYRHKFPELAIGSLASSAPVEAKENFSEYDAAVATAAGPACAAKMRDVVAALESSLDKPEELAKYKALFKSESIDDPVEFLYVVADMGAIAVQYGFQEELCNSLATGSDPVQAYADVGNQLFAMFGLTPEMDSSKGVVSENPQDYMAVWGMRQWLYQSCTQFGFWQVANSDPNLTARSHLIDLAYHRRLCAKVFGMPIVAQPDDLNKSFYEPMRAASSATSNILLINGSNDPWSHLSLTAERNNNNNTNLDLYTIAGGSHCTDLGAPSANDSQSLAQAHSLTEDSMARWLGHTSVPEPSPAALFLNLGLSNL